MPIFFLNKGKKFLTLLIAVKTQIFRQLSGPHSLAYINRFAYKHRLDIIGELVVFSITVVKLDDDIKRQIILFASHFQVFSMFISSYVFKFLSGNLRIAVLCQ